MQRFTIRQDHDHAWFLTSSLCLFLSLSSSLVLAETNIDANSEVVHDVEDLCQNTSNELLSIIYAGIEEISGAEQPLLLVSDYEGSLRDCWTDIAIPKSFAEMQASLSELLIYLSLKENASIPKGICRVSATERSGSMYYIIRLPTNNFYITEQACIDIFEHSKNAVIEDGDLVQDSHKP